MQHTPGPGADSPSSGGARLDKISYMQPIGYRNNSCGYCHNKSGSQHRYSYYAASEYLTPQFYEDLLYRGWRRSGTLLYKPDQRVSCCPHYTIRLDALAFKPTKDQRQAVNRFNRFVLGEDYIKESTRIRPKSKEESARRKQEFGFSERVHESERETLRTPPEPAHDFVVTLESSQFTEEKYALFENYQRIVHHEPPHRITRSGFRSFLCETPLVQHVEAIDGQNRKLGSYHQCYRLDGKLVAVGVLDLLPHAVSAVYFMYHESIHTWAPGKLSAIRETALAAEEGYKWYMMGFYIHDCKKMRYKVDYHPQYMLDPESYEWDLLDNDLKRRLDARPFVSLWQENRDGIKAPEKGNGTKYEEVDENTTNSEWQDDEDRSDPEGSLENLSIFSRRMPGIDTPDLVDGLPLNLVTVRVRGQKVLTSDLVNWEGGSIHDPHSLRGIIAELVATVGYARMPDMCVVFS